MPNFYQNTHNIYNSDWPTTAYNINLTDAIRVDEVGYHIPVPESMRSAIKELFDDWCREIVDKKLDVNTMDKVIPALNSCRNMSYQLEEQIKECDKKISFLQTQLEKLQEQLKYLGFERLLME